MPLYDIDMDVMLTCHREVEADNEQEAIKQLENLAYEDSWSTGMAWGGAKVYMIEEVEGDNDE